MVIVKNARCVHITDLDDDWAWNEATNGWPEAPSLRVHSIQFIPSAANDQCVIRDGHATTGPIIFDVTCADVTDSRVKYFNGMSLRPIYDDSAGTINTDANASIIIMLNREG